MAQMETRIVGTLGARHASTLKWVAGMLIGQAGIIAAVVKLIG
jgi:hypothetical protein